ncbi:hypothetical protein D3C87_1425670 [compost metagenome]
MTAHWLAQQDIGQFHDLAVGQHRLVGQHQVARLAQRLRAPLHHHGGGAGQGGVVEFAGVGQAGADGGDKGARLDQLAREQRRGRARGGDDDVGLRGGHGRIGKGHGDAALRGELVGQPRIGIGVHHQHAAQRQRCGQLRRMLHALRAGAEQRERGALRPGQPLRRQYRAGRRAQPRDRARIE